VCTHFATAPPRTVPVVWARAGVNATLALLSDGSVLLLLDVEGSDHGAVAAQQRAFLRNVCDMVVVVTAHAALRSFLTDVPALQMALAIAQEPAVADAPAPAIVLACNKCDEDERDAWSPVAWGDMMGHLRGHEFVAVRDAAAALHTATEGRVRVVVTPSCAVLKALARNGAASADASPAVAVTVDLAAHEAAHAGRDEHGPACTASLAAFRQLLLSARRHDGGERAVDDVVRALGGFAYTPDHGARLAAAARSSLAALTARAAAGRIADDGEAADGTEEGAGVIAAGGAAEYACAMQDAKATLRREGATQAELDSAAVPTVLEVHGRLLAALRTSDVAREAAARLLAPHKQLADHNLQQLATTARATVSGRVDWLDAALGAATECAAVAGWRSPERVARIVGDFANAARRPLAATGHHVQHAAVDAAVTALRADADAMVQRLREANAVKARAERQRLATEALAGVQASLARATAKADDTLELDAREVLPGPLRAAVEAARGAYEAGARQLVGSDADRSAVWTPAATALVDTEAVRLLQADITARQASRREVQRMKADAAEAAKRTAGELRKAEEDAARDRETAERERGERLKAQAETDRQTKLREKEAALRSTILATEGKNATPELVRCIKAGDDHGALYILTGTIWRYDINTVDKAAFGNDARELAVEVVKRKMSPEVQAAVLQHPDLHVTWVGCYNMAAALWNEHSPTTEVALRVTALPPHEAAGGAGAERRMTASDLWAYIVRHCPHDAVKQHASACLERYTTWATCTRLVDFVKLHHGAWGFLELVKMMIGPDEELDALIASSLKVLEALLGADEWLRKAFCRPGRQQQGIRTVTWHDGATLTAAGVLARGVEATTGSDKIELLKALAARLQGSETVVVSGEARDSAWARDEAARLEREAAAAAGAGGAAGK
jgi:hypothetical protein